MYKHEYIEYARIHVTYYVCIWKEKNIYTKYMSYLVIKRLIKVDKMCKFNLLNNLKLEGVLTSYQQKSKGFF